MLKLGVDQAPEIEHLIVDEEFYIARVRCRCDQVRVQIVKPVGAHRHPVTRGGRGNAPPLRDAAANQGVGLKNFGSPLVEKFLVIPAAVANFSRRHRCSSGARQAGVQVDLVRTERLLDPVWLIWFVSLHVAHRSR